MATVMSQLHDTARIFRWYHYHGLMPTINMFYGILIRMFFNDHPPPSTPERV
ncbi:hypothetical protein SBA6_340019 [Candidatus Sulfopaludibacter sp. SbA6]|nr:hypothetical protein SBA6_340019 [Candidatus Sulfopaludibacter sp. SbA6]